MKKLKHPELVELILAVVDKILHVEKGRVLEAEGVKLHPSEIHLLLFLHAHPHANAKEIAHRFSVTKGAVSQTISRLEAKGVLTKERNPEAQTELALSLTSTSAARQIISSDSAWEKTSFFSKGLSSGRSPWST
jgi:DNA-binding MarR family transcriptional regulator